MNNSEEYIKKWFFNKIKFSSYVEYINPNESVPVADLIRVLGIDTKDMKGFSKETLNFFTDSETYQEFSNAIRAFTQFQDIFNLSLNGNDLPSERDMFNRHYCYFEGLIYLRESVSSWLDGNILHL